MEEVLVSECTRIKRNQVHSAQLQCIKQPNLDHNKTRTLTETDPIWPSFDHWTLEEEAFSAL